MSVRRVVTSLLLALGVVAAPLLLSAPAATAAGPVELGSDHVVDQAGVLSDADVHAIETATTALTKDHGIDLYVVFVDRFTDPADAKLPRPPERGPKDGTFAGFASFKTAPKAGLYAISLSSGAWIDVVQDGHFLKPKGFSGATDCDGIRKTMKYELSASPFVLQISGAKDDSISVAILPAE